jgi:hypothetical protein
MERFESITFYAFFVLLERAERSAERFAIFRAAAEKAGTALVERVNHSFSS